LNRWQTKDKHCHITSKSKKFK